MRPRRKAIAALVMLAIILGWPVASHYRAKHRVAAYKRQLITQGEKMSVQENTPPPRVVGENGAVSLQSALWTIGSINYTNQPPVMRSLVPGRALVAWQQAALPTEDSTNVWPDLAEDLERKSDALEEIRTALGKPTLVFNLDYSQGFHMTFAPLAQIKGAAQWLSAATALELHEGRVTNALDNLSAMTALVSHYKDEPLMISSLVRIAIAAITVNTVWEALQSSHLTEEQLARLQADWEAVDFLTQAEAALAMERAMSEKYLADLRASPRSLLAAMNPMGGGVSPGSGLDELMELGKGVLDDPRQGLKELLHRYPGYWGWKWWWSYDDELAQMQYVQADLIALRELRKEKCFAPALQRCEQANEAIRKARPKARAWFDFGLASVSQNYLGRLRTIEVQRHLLVTGIALKRFQLRHGHYPEGLSALAPEFLRETPGDPIDGQPLRYRLQADGSFLLYSIGQDAEDNGGDPKPAEGSSKSLQWQKGRDWVWPQPATTEEIEIYFESLRKKHAEVANSTNVMSAEQRAFMERYGLSATNSVSPPSPPPPTNTVQ
jgi:hypothetical protein